MNDEISPPAAVPPSPADAPPTAAGVVHLTADLVLTSRVGQLCRQRQIPYRVIPRLAKLGDACPGTLLIDLQAPGWNAAEYRNLSGERIVAQRVVAYAQHVATELLAAAQELGLTAVMTRGQFDARFGDWLSD